MKKLILLFFSMILLFNSCVSQQENSSTAETKVIETPQQLEVSNLFSDFMVLQRNKPLPVWGKGLAGRTVEVTFQDQVKTALVGDNNSWEVELNAMGAQAEPQIMKIAYADENDPQNIFIKEILVGDVWFLSGQSNMEFGMNGVDGITEEKKDMDYPEIRLLRIDKIAAGTAQENIKSHWMPTNSTTVLQGGWGGFSAVGFMFGRELYHEIGVPVGLIQAAFGGSKIDTWIPPEELASGGLYLFNQNKLVKRITREYQDALAQDPKARHPWDNIGSDYSKLQPTTSYNAMVAPVAPFAITGILWYQGESDIGDGDEYTDKMIALIKAFRRVFRDENLPFYYAGLAPWNYGSKEQLPVFWEAQAAVMEKVSNIGMASTRDIGNPDDIHPTHKRPLAERFVNLALSGVYGREGIVTNGPVYKDSTIEDGKFTISFTNDEGIHNPDGSSEIPGFELAGADRRFKPAQAELVGSTIIVWSEEVPEPVNVRFAWDGLAKIVLVNKQGLPARPFRTRN